MKYLYDLHVHSGLSPCADDDMTPINIVAAASAKGINIVAITDHNSIKNVKLTMEIGKALDVAVIPGMELQTNEDIHILCFFDTYENLEKFYNTINFKKIKNRPDIFGRQLVYDDDDNIAYEEDLLLSIGAEISEYEVQKRAQLYNGIAVPAHIDRDDFGMLARLGAIPDGYTALELTQRCSARLMEKYLKSHIVITGSDSHTLEDIGSLHKIIDLPEPTSSALIRYLNKV